MKKFINILFVLQLFVLAVGCMREDLQPGSEVEEITGSGKTVRLSFNLAGDGDIFATKAEYSNGDMIKEEGHVDKLLYAIFHNETCMTYVSVDLSGEGYNTSSNNIYSVPISNEEWFDETTEIFAVANPSASLENALMASATLSGEALQALVSDSLAKAAGIAAINSNISSVFNSRRYPKDSKLYYKPASSSNYTTKQYNMSTSQVFSTWAEFQQKRAASTGTALTMYNAIAEDLECRLALFWQTSYNSQLSTLTATENSDHAIENYLASNPSFSRYDLWHDYIYDEDLNATAAASDSRMLDSPLMAGYLALTGNNGSVITVPVEHVYCRIWFQFDFTGDAGSAFATDEVYVDLDSIRVEGLAGSSRLFNTNSVMSQNNEGTNNAAASISSMAGSVANTGQTPFFGKLTANPQHYGTSINILRYYPDQPDYDIVCRYPVADGNFDTDNARRYYIYSYQWIGTYLVDNPKIYLNYCFKAANDTDISHKTAWAYLYDETHEGGKLHYGILRNYTYGVNCQINVNTADLTLQVIPKEWYTHEVEDIPAFE